MKTSVSLVYTEQGTNKKGQKSITDVNPNATGAEIKAFTTALNNLTTNIYGETNRVQVINVDTEEVPAKYDDLPDPPEFTITQVETFDQSALVGGHAVHFATVTPASRATMNALKFRVALVDIATPIAVYSEKSTGKLYLVSTSEFTLSNGTIYVYGVYANMKDSASPPLYDKLQEFQFTIPITTS